MTISGRGIFVGAILGAALWAIILGAIFSPWLILAGGVILAVVFCTYPEEGSSE